MADLFVIDNITGAITVSSPLQTLSSIYTLVVIVRDQGEPPLESSRTLIVNVVDVNDDTPTIIFPKPNDVIYIEEVRKNISLWWLLYGISGSKPQSSQTLVVDVKIEEGKLSPPQDRVQT